MDYSLILKEFSERFYTPPILAITELFAIVIGLKYCKKDNIAKFFIAFISFDFVILITDWALLLMKDIPQALNNKFVNYTNTLISIFEISVYYYYFSVAIKNKIPRILFLAPAIVYSVIASISSFLNLSLFNLGKTHTYNLIYSLELALLLPPIIIFLFQIINTNHETSLLSRPSFWIAVGIFFQSIISIPCYLLIAYFLKQKTNYLPFIEATLYYTPLITNTLFISKAFLCKKTLTI